VRELKNFKSCLDFWGGILPIIKYWIPHLHIIEPKWIRDILEKDLEVYQKELKN